MFAFDAWSPHILKGEVHLVLSVFKERHEKPFLAKYKPKREPAALEWMGKRV
jgi:hypothetical protein